VVLAPARACAWWGARGLGATARDASGDTRKIAVRKAPAGAIVAIASRSHRDAETQAFLDEAGVAECISAGSSLKFCLVAEGKADLYPRFGRTMEWDVAAGHAVLTAAGGTVTTQDGAPFRYRKPGFENPAFIARGA
jgi:3'(2'), 5'-bisphosphate nucleotidase